MKRLILLSVIALLISAADAQPGRNPDSPVYTIKSYQSGSGTNIDVDNAVGNVVVSIDTKGMERCSVTILNEDDASNATIDEFWFFLNPPGRDSTQNVAVLSEADFASPVGAMLMAFTGTPSGEADGAVDATLDEGDVLSLWFDVAGFGSLVIEAGATADNSDVSYWYSCE